jgi:hypothetical protein
VLPEKIHGAFLLPLNEQKKILPKLYKENIQKYSKRKSVMKTKIPLTNSTWSDVIHLTPIHPKKFKAALKKAGLKPKDNVHWIKINPYKLDRGKAVLYKYTSNSVSANQFLSLKPNQLNQYNKISNKVLTYYKECIQKDTRPLLFHLVPHILYKGRISIKNTQIISWD